jgi:mycothiol synthase
VRSDRPQIREITTATAAANGHMARVNYSLGFVTTGAMIAVSAQIADLQL